jgi:hypothetical protein
MSGTKADYFAQSREFGLPPHCPIVGRCARRLSTIELANGLGYTAKERQRTDLIPEIGAPVSQIGGTSNFIASNLCPEVTLFEGEHFYGGFTGVALRTAQYDKYMDPQIEFLEYGHFSECAEFAYQNTENYRGLSMSGPDNVTNNNFNFAGANSRVNINSIDRSYNVIGSPDELRELSLELTRLREALVSQAKSPDDYTMIGHVAQAEAAAIAGNEAKMAPALAALGNGAKWVLGTAKDIGVSLAVKVIEQHIGV